MTPQRPSQVLVVDDDPTIRDLLREFLSTMGVERVETADGGRSGLRLIDQGWTPDVILSDLDMPDMDGIEFLRHLGVRGVRSGIILVSAMESRLVQSVGGLTRSHELYLLGILPKPVPRDELERLLQSYDASGGRSDARSTLQSITEAELVDGLADHLCVFFQPQVRIATGKVHGFEALARWRHPDRGVLGPGAFLPVAEETGHMDALTERAMELAIAECGRWLAAGLDLSVSVNIAMSNLLRMDLPDFVVACAASAGVASSHIVVELTEGQVMKNLKPSLESLGRMRLKGVGLSIDDFGTGYSSLEQLKRAPFTELKIDRSFVFGAASDPAARAILESSAALGQKLGMTVVAEGAEAREEWDLTASAGCDLVQGYYVARPMPGADVIEWVRTWEQRTSSRV